jgi:dimethylamine monooxygenase subunit C
MLVTEETRMASARLEWTSVPRWPSAELPAAASYLACWFGDLARPRVQELLAAADPGVSMRLAGFADRWDADAEEELLRLVGGCLTGVRIILAGPESIVMQAMAVARRLGASDEELVPVAIDARNAPVKITARSAERSAPSEAPPEAGAGNGGYVSGIAGRRVFCAACRRSFDAVAAIGGSATCPECAAELIVDKRFSRPHAAYFGWPAGLDLHQ